MGRSPQNAPSARTFYYNVSTRRALKRRHEMEDHLRRFPTDERVTKTRYEHHITPTALVVGKTNNLSPQKTMFRGQQLGAAIAEETTSRGDTITITTAVSKTTTIQKTSPTDELVAKPSVATRHSANYPHEERLATCHTQGRPLHPCATNAKN